MRTINIHEAKTHLSRLVDEAEQGEPFMIAKAGKPKVQVIRLDAPADPGKAPIGFLKGKYQGSGQLRRDRQGDGQGDREDVLGEDEE